MIKRKIKLGFLLIGALLFLSGIISSLELIRLNTITSELVHASRGNIVISKNLLDAVQEQNTLLLLSITDSTVDYEPGLLETRNQFSSTLSEIKESFKGNSGSATEIANIERSAVYYNNIVNSASLDMTLDWFVQVYRTTYNNLTGSIKDFMIVTENSIVESAEEVEQNAIRASMVGIIALGSGIMLIVLFYFFINSFYIAPVVNIVNSLRRHLDKGIPFSVEVHTKDELLSLKTHIEILIERSKR